MLTAKQEKYVRNLIKGMTQREAYKNSYDAENMADETIDKEACLLFNTPKITERYRELQEKLDNATIMSAKERLEYLTGIIQDTERETVVIFNNDGESVEVQRPADFGDKLKAIDIMNKMQGEYVTKVEGNLTVKLEDLI